MRNSFLKNECLIIINQTEAELCHAFWVTPNCVKWGVVIPGTNILTEWRNEAESILTSNEKAIEPLRKNRMKKTNT